MRTAIAIVVVLLLPSCHPDKQCPPCPSCVVSATAAAAAPSDPRDLLNKPWSFVAKWPDEKKLVGTLEFSNRRAEGGEEWLDVLIALDLKSPSAGEAWVEAWAIDAEGVEHRCHVVPSLHMPEPGRKSKHSIGYPASPPMTRLELKTGEGAAVALTSKNGTWSVE